MARKDKMKLDEMKKLLKEAKRQKLRIKISLSDDQTDWRLIASILVENSSSGSIELDPPMTEADLCMAALGHDLSAFEDGVVFFPTSSFDIDAFLASLPPGASLRLQPEKSNLLTWPLGSPRNIRPC
jgi:hypothetical protein